MVLEGGKLEKDGLRRREGSSQQPPYATSRLGGRGGLRRVRNMGKRETVTSGGGKKEACYYWLLRRRGPWSIGRKVKVRVVKNHMAKEGSKVRQLGRSSR